MCGVASQGRPGFLDQGGWFVKTYTLAYSKDGENWANYKEFGIAKVKICTGLLTSTGDEVTLFTRQDRLNSK